MKVGARVVVSIQNRNEYARGAADSLDGKRGEIKDVKKDESAFLVQFDEPAAKWWAYQSEVNAFWFDLKDLREEMKRG